MLKHGTISPNILSLFAACTGQNTLVRITEFLGINLQQ
jgi:hypothetical protein